jgi:plasmid stabilization system protein ParE
MNFYFHPDAEAELDKAVDYYEGCQTGLGLALASEVFAAIKRIIKYPEAWAKASRNTRRCLISRFPYGVIYQIKYGQLRIIAVAHLNRKPGYWKQRIQ